jgi:CHASE3 domain sensor protein
MIDSAGLATTAIGLHAVGREQELYDALVPQPSRKAHKSSIRLAAAAALRWMADTLEPRRRFDATEPGSAG